MPSKPAASYEPKTGSTAPTYVSWGSLRIDNVIPYQLRDLGGPKQHLLHFRSGVIPGGRDRIKCEMDPLASGGDRRIGSDEDVYSCSQLRRSGKFVDGIFRASDHHVCDSG